MAIRNHIHDAAYLLATRNLVNRLLFLKAFKAQDFSYLYQKAEPFGSEIDPFLLYPLDLSTIWERKEKPR